ncbi:MAG TPA: hypothetical protein VNU66_01920 [Mycobacteriales bacterium]|nr:hypothetical protein [Mycobacteriales bacterium]
MGAGEVVPLPQRGAWLADARDDAVERGRALRVSWHAEQGCAVLSTWRDGRCTGTARLRPDEVARLVSALAHGLAEGASSAGPATGTVVLAAAPAPEEPPV